MQAVPYARPQSPMETLRRSKCPRNSCHSSSVGLAVFLGGAQASSAGQERAVGSDGQIQPVEAFDSTSSVNNSEGFFQL